MSGKMAPEPRDTHIVNIGHVSLQTRDMGPMLHFYRDILGMGEQFILTVGEFADSLRGDNGGEIPAAQRAYLESMGPDPDRPWIVYLKLADRQFLELFYDMGGNRPFPAARRECYGYVKCNYETADAAGLRDRLAAGGVPIREDLHTVADGALEFSVLDPEGNEVQFTQYPADSPLPLIEGPDHSVCSLVRHTTQAAYQVKDAAGMEHFYCQGLGLKKVLTLTYADLCRHMRAAGETDAEALRGLEALGDRPWIDYIRVGPRQFLELFHTDGQTLREERDLRGTYGYQHICLEVTDIRAAYTAVLANGLTPDGPVSKGADGAYQLWLTDPDGNRLELMEYAPGAKQIAE